ncbi:MAG: response regulator [Magnetococcales bacterium]|nr:response regulator [Magnetococcales bacterium]
MKILHQLMDRLTRIGIRSRFYLSFYLVVVLSISGVSYYGYHTAHDVLYGKALALVSQKTERLSKQIENILYDVPADLIFLSSAYALHRTLFWQDLAVANKVTSWRTQVLETFDSFLKARTHYVSIRFFDQNGDSTIELLSDDHLHSASHRGEGVLRMVDANVRLSVQYYLEGDRQDYFALPMSFNTRDGKIEKPFLPVVRFAQPVIGENGVDYGTIEVRVDAKYLFETLQKAEQQEDWDFYLVSADGSYLYHADAQKQWGALLGHDASLSQDFPALFAQLANNSTGIVDIDDHVMSYKRISLKRTDESHVWYLISSVNQTAVMESINFFIIVFIGILVTTLAMALLVSRVTIDSVLKPINAVTRQLERLGKGEMVQEVIHYSGQDSIAEMLVSANRLMDNMANTITQVESISRGDYKQRVVLLSQKDQLGTAINTMSQILQDSQSENRVQNWLNEGIGQLSRQLSGDLSLQVLSERALSFVARYLEAGQGVFYDIQQDDTGIELTLVASYMFTERHRISNRFRLGQGVIGQVAREKKPILLKNISRTEREITTGLVTSKPLNSMTLPLVYQEALQGVMELVSFIPFDKNHQTFLDQATDVIAVALFSARQRMQVKQLLDLAEENAKVVKVQNRKLQASNDRMEIQQRQLQEANNQMEEQQQQLQQQTEELQHSNAQMEEQQQQLQQQTEELQQTNAQMEEQQQQLQQQTEELESKNEALRTSRDEINSRAKQLEEANQYKSDFLANMSHELRTPLNAIIVISKMLFMNEEGKLDEETVKRAQVVFDSGNDLLRLINDILDLSKVEAGRVDLHWESFSSVDVAEELNALFIESFREKSLRFVVEDQFQGVLTSDRNKLVQVLRNLLGNALKFTQEGQVTLKFERNDDHNCACRILVSDTGIGIPQDKLAQVFEAFRQVDGSISRQFGGTGLGLSISRKFVDLLGGTLSVSSVAGEGSTFTVCLPLEIDNAHVVSNSVTRISQPPTRQQKPLISETEPESITLSEENLKQPAGDGPAVLVIDDDIHFQDSIVLINRQYGHRVLLAETGRQGLAMAAKHRPQGIILDMGLPDMGGDQVLRTLKTDPDLKDIPIYVISAQDRDPTLLENGVMGVLQKPVTDDEIVAAEVALLGAVSQQVYRSILMVEGLTLKQDLIENRIVETGGRLTVSHSAKEGLALVEKQSFDLILVDHDLDDMDCVVFCEQIRVHQPDVALIIYGSGSFGESRASDLRRFTDSIIQQAPSATQRLFEDIDRFLSKTERGTAQESVSLSAISSDKLLEQRRIMIVDDDPRNLFVLTASLEQHGAVVITALNGLKALALLKKESVDLVFMDIMMPDMNGYEAIEQIRADADLMHLPIIALTAKALKEDRQKCMDAGADDYLSKPVDYEVLVNMAKAWIEKGA